MVSCGHHGVVTEYRIVGEGRSRQAFTGSKGHRARFVFQRLHPGRPIGPCFRRGRACAAKSPEPLPFSRQAVVPVGYFRNGRAIALNLFESAAARENGFGLAPIGYGIFQAVRVFKRLLERI